MALLSFIPPFYYSFMYYYITLWLSTLFVSLPSSKPSMFFLCFTSSSFFLSAWPVSSVKALRNYSQWLFPSAWAYIGFLADTWGAPRSAKLLLLYLPYTSVNRNILLLCLEKAKALHMNQTSKPLLVSTRITLVLTPLWKYYGIIR